LTLNKTIPKAGIFRITLVETSREVDPDSDCFQTQTLAIPKHQKTVELTSLNPFKFRADQEVARGAYVLKYEIEGLEDGLVSSVPLTIPRVINEFKLRHKNMYQDRCEAKHSTL
jgi:hypothetical protein